MYKASESVRLQQFTISGFKASKSYVDWRPRPDGNMKHTDGLVVENARIRNNWLMVLTKSKDQESPVGKTLISVEW